MPRKKKHAMPLSEYTFVNLHLVSDEVKELLSLIETDELPLEGFMALVDDGYKLSFSYDEMNDSYVASMTDKRDSSGTYGVILTGRGDSVLNAWYSLAYKHFVKLDGDWTDIQSKTAKRDKRFS